MKKKDAKKLKYVIGIVVVLTAIIYEIIFGDLNLDLDFISGNSTTVVTATTVQNLNVDSNTLQIYYFDVGQADSILIVSNNESLLIDGGNDADGKLVANYIKSDLGISTINYLVGTHPHEDHIGGLDKIIDELTIQNVYMPYYTSGSKELEQVLDSLDKKNLSITVPNVDDTFTVGNTTCTIMAVDNSEPSNINLSSIVIRMVYNDQSYLFMGDAETKNESKRDWPETNVLKAGHHGSETSSSKKFLEQVLPEITIISCGLNNSYGHPKQVILDRLAAINTSIYRTDKDGTILISSDGTSNMVQKLDVHLDGNK